MLRPIAEERGLWGKGLGAPLAAPGVYEEEKPVEKDSNVRDANISATDEKAVADENPAAAPLLLLCAAIAASSSACRASVPLP